MGDLVCDGTEFSCPFCTGSLKLKVPSSSSKGDSKKLANMTNCFFPPPGGNCIVVPSAPVPCTPAANPIDPGQSPVNIDGAPALGAGCKFMCAKGGLITVSSAGQGIAKHDGASGAKVEEAADAMAETGVAEHAAKKKEDDEKNDKEKKDKDKTPSTEPKKKSQPASAPVGKKEAPMKNNTLQKTRNPPEEIGGVQYSGHAVDQMQNRGIPPSVVKNTIKTGEAKTVKKAGKHSTNFFCEKNNITAVTNKEGKVITVGHGKIGRK